MNKNNVEVYIDGHYTCYFVDFPYQKGDFVTIGTVQYEVEYLDEHKVFLKEISRTAI